MFDLKTRSIFLFQILKSWFKLPNGNWDLVKILSTAGTESVVSLTDGKVKN